MKLKFIIFIFLLFLITISTSFAMEARVGGWTVAKVTDDDVVDAGNFAVGQTYNSNSLSHKIIYAEKQVVAGMNYKLTIDTTLLPDRTCHSDIFIVYNRFGTKSVTSRESNPAGCTSVR
jgi:hypothetical protein